MSAPAHPVSLRALRQHLAERWPEPGALHSPSGDRWLAAIAGTALALAALIALWGGPHSGFAALNEAAAWLPGLFWSVATSFGDGYVLAALALFFARRHPHVPWILFLGVVIGGVLTHGPKEWFDASRPAGVLAPDSFNLVGPGHSRGSLPSGHSLAIFMVSGIGIYLLRATRWRVALLVTAALIAFSRIAVGEHWPLDVTLGAALGALSAWLSVTFGRLCPAGRNVWVHLVLLALFLVVACWLLVFDPPYPLGRQVNLAVGVLALLWTGYSYLYAPWRDRPAAGVVSR